MVKQILVWLLVAWAWWALIYFSQGVADMFGRVDWFERNMWSTRNGIISWFLIIIIGFLILFGVFPVSAPVTDTVQQVSQ